MKYETVNLDAWKRGNLFRFYIDNLRNVMSMTVDIDVSSLIAFVRAYELVGSFKSGQPTCRIQVRLG